MIKNLIIDGNNLLYRASISLIQNPGMVKAPQQFMVFHIS